MKNLYYFTLLLFSFQLNAQFGLNSAFKIGSTGSDKVHAIKFDGAGNSYVVGEFNGTVDFDPGPGVVSRSSPSGPSVFFEKFDFCGNLVWVNVIPRTTTSWAYSNLDIGVDAAGDVYVAGNFDFTVDFDPSAGVFNLFSTGNLDVFYAKYSTTGNFMWAKGITSWNCDHMSKMDVSPAGDIAIAMVISGAGIDLDPGPGVAAYPGAGYPCNIFLAKYNSAGTYVWSQYIMNCGSNWSGVTDISFDGSGDIYLTGLFQLTLDFDPGPGVFNMSSAGLQDVFLVKYNGTTGNLVWARRMGSALDDIGYNIVINPASTNVYLVAAFHNTVDFDPGAGVSNLISLGGYDMAISCFDLLGSFVWAKSVGGTGDDFPYGVSIDLCDNIYVGGSVSSASIDLDPSASVANFVTAGSSDLCLAKYTSLGNYVTGAVMGSGGIDNVYTVNYNLASSVLFIGGDFSNTVDFDPTSAVSNIASSGSTDGFVAKYFQNIVPPTNTTPTANLNLSSCISVTTTLNAASNFSMSCSTNTAISTLYWYSAATGGVLLGSGSSLTTAPINTTTTFYVMDSVPCVGKSIRVPITVNYTHLMGPTVIITPSTNTLCSGYTSTLTASGGATTFSWIPSSASLSSLSGLSTVASPTVTSTYTLIGAVGDCTNSAITTISVVPSPITAVLSNTNSTCGLCNGAISVVASNGLAPYIYSWSPSVSTQTLVTNLCSDNYSVSITDANKCKSTFSYSILPSSVFESSVSASSVEVFQGQPITLSGMGGVSYTWSPITNLTCSNCPITVATPMEDMSYCVNATSVDGCKDTACVDVYIKCGEVFVPNAFSPNNDGHNDELIVFGNCIKDLVFRVYDRWGELVYESFDTSNKWDGKYKGYSVTAGVFVYQLSAQLNSGDYITKNGNITVVK